MASEPTVEAEPNVDNIYFDGVVPMNTIYVCEYLFRILGDFVLYDLELKMETAQMGR